jgi:pantetheine-phosphate adenylyltransferase
VKRAVYAGTFDPITIGHLSVIERAARLFDELLVVVAVNPQKDPLFSAPERVELVQAVVRQWSNVSACETNGYVVELARARGARYLVRGVRGTTDTESELELSRLNRALAPEIETVFVPAHSELSEVSSSRLKELVRAGASAEVERFCPAPVCALLKEKLGV